MHYSAQVVTLPPLPPLSQSFEKPPHEASASTSVPLYLSTLRSTSRGQIRRCGGTYVSSPTRFNCVGRSLVLTALASHGARLRRLVLVAVCSHLDCLIGRLS